MLQNDCDSCVDFCMCYLDERMSECEDPGKDPLELTCATHKYRIALNNVLDFTIARGEPLDEDQVEVWESLPCQDMTHFTTEFAIKEHDCDECNTVDMCSECNRPKLRQCGCSLCITPLERLIGGSHNIEGCANPLCGKPAQDYKGLPKDCPDRVVLKNVKEVKLSGLAPYYCEGCWTFIKDAELPPCVLCLGLSCSPSLYPRYP